jgi:hypothetical protein
MGQRDVVGWVTVACLALAQPAWADVVTDTSPPETEDKADDEGCSTLASPVTGGSLLLGALLLAGLRRR